MALGRRDGSIGHLRELRRPLSMIGIDGRKPQRLAGTYRDNIRSGVTNVTYQLSLDHVDLTALVSMGQPRARHIMPQALKAHMKAQRDRLTGGEERQDDDLGSGANGTLMARGSASGASEVARDEAPKP